MTRTSSKTHRARIASIVAAAALTAALAGCVAPVGPIEVTRFHAPDIAALGHGTIAVVAAPGSDENSLEIRSYEAAVARQLTVLGYTEAPAATAQTLATVHLDRRVVQPQRARHGWPKRCSRTSPDARERLSRCDEHADHRRRFRRR